MECVTYAGDSGNYRKLLIVVQIFEIITQDLIEAILADHFILAHFIDYLSKRSVLCPAVRVLEYWPKVDLRYVMGLAESGLGFLERHVNVSVVRLLALSKFGRPPNLV